MQTSGVEVMMLDVFILAPMEWPLNASLDFGLLL